MDAIRIVASLISAAVLLLLQSPAQKVVPTPLERLQAKIDVVSVGNLTVAQVAGQYNNPSDEEKKRTPPMGGDSLFLFPDNTYIYTTVSDIPPDTISDKGTWKLTGDTVDLTSDGDVVWKFKNAERQYVLVRRRGRGGEIFAVGTDRDLKYFEVNAQDDPEFMFLLNSMKRERAVLETETAELRRELMKEKWKPSFYKEN